MFCHVNVGKFLHNFKTSANAICAIPHFLQVCIPYFFVSREEESGSLKQVKFNITGKEPPVEILEVECVLADFFEAGITNIIREGGQQFWN